MIEWAVATLWEGELCAGFSCALKQCWRVFMRTGFEDGAVEAGNHLEFQHLLLRSRDLLLQLRVAPA